MHLIYIMQEGRYSLPNIMCTRKLPSPCTISTADSSVVLELPYPSLMWYGFIPRVNFQVLGRKAAWKTENLVNHTRQQRKLQAILEPDSKYSPTHKVTLNARSQVMLEPDYEPASAIAS